MNEPVSIKQYKDNLKTIADCMSRMNWHQQDVLVSFAEGAVAIIDSLAGEEYAAESDKNSKHENTET